MNDPQRFTVIYRIGGTAKWEWKRAMWTDSLPFAEAQARTIARMGYEAHAVNYLSSLPTTFSYVPAR